MVTNRARLASVDIPVFGIPDREPELPPALFQDRLSQASVRAHGAGLDYLVVYGDREHFANLMYLTGHDPRFEEALLVVSTGDRGPVLIVGNEGMTYSELMPIKLERRLYQGFSLPGQDRSESPQLERVLPACGIRRGSRVGLVGWKYATELESADPARWLDVPAFIADALRQLVGDASLVRNAAALFMDPVDGLRSVNDVHQLAVFEFAAVYSSQAVRAAIEFMRPGMNEFEAVRSMGLNGMPLTAHPNLSSGPRSRFALPSPSSRTIQRGDPFFVGLGLRGALTARAGFVVEGASELPTESADYLERLVEPYFASAVAWYERLGLGVEAGELHRVVAEVLGPHGLGLALNAGHLIHLEEWVHSPVFAGSKAPLRSGMLIQCDLIPIADARLHTTNIEDTVALADLELRNELARSYPAAWQRIQARRDFMIRTLGIELRPEVLPFSNLPAVLQPFSLNPGLVMVAQA